MKKKVIYIGNLYTVAEYIYFDNNYDLIGILCEEDRVNDNILTFSLVRNIPIFRITKEKTIDGYINNQDEDVIFIMCSYGRRVPAEKCKKHKIYNIHYAALPNYKGRHPSYWATVNNEMYLGVSIHVVTEKFDQGDIISQKKVPYYLWENEGDVFDKLTEQVPELLKDLNAYLLSSDTYELIPNMEGGYYNPVEVSDITIDIENDSPNLIFNKVRSQSRANGARVKVINKEFVLHDICFTEKKINAEYVIEDKLYIRYGESLCIVVSDYEEVD